MKFIIMLIVCSSLISTSYANHSPLLEKRLQQVRQEYKCDHKFFVHPPGAIHLYEDVYFTEEIGKYRVVNGKIIPIDDE